MSQIESFFLLIIKSLYDITGNYGWAIVLLTIIIRILIFPLTFTGMKSMRAMQALQPKIKDLQKKYKDDKEQLNKELLALYKTAGANPISGCLPMLLQLPIFWALFRLLRSPEANGYIFVNNSFYGMDLTAAAFSRLSGEFLADLQLVLPGMVNLSKLGIAFFNNSYLYLPTLILVIFMTVTFILSQKSMTVDPSQASQMMMMNVFIIFISATMPAGVLLYWGMSNFIQILQQKMVPSFSPASNRAPKSGTYREEAQKQALEQENGKAGKTITEAGGNTDKVAQQKYTKKKRKRKKKRK